MKFEIYKISAYGIKNIEKEISIEFSNANLINTKTKRVIGLFGANGTGKSSFIHSIDILQRLIEDNRYLNQNDNQKELFELINHKTKTFYIKCFYGVKLDGETKINYSYEIELKKNDEKRVYISKEKLSLLKGKSINNIEEKVIYSIKEGEWESVDDESKYYIDKTKNILLTSSFISNFTGLVNASELSPGVKEVSCICLIALSMDIHVSLEFEDYHNNIDQYALSKAAHKLHLGDIIDTTTFYINDEEEEFVFKEDYSLYQKDISGMLRFLAIFKPSLKNIKLKKETDKDFYRVKKIMQYDDYDVDIKYESAGMKKLIKLYSHLKKAYNGKIVFIDEMDSCLNGVLLKKIIEFFDEYGEGTLFFSSHNTLPMDVLKNDSKSIYFLGETGKLIPWIKNGHYSPDNQYNDGMIEDSPFNFESYDLIKAFLINEEV